MLDTTTTPPPIDPTTPPTIATAAADAGGPTIIIADTPAPTTRGKGKSHKKKPDPAAGPSSPPPPFVGGPPEGDERSRAQNVAAGAAQAQQKVAAVTIDPKVAAESLVGLVDGAFGMFAQSRYGTIVDPASGKSLVELFAVTSEERENLVAAVVLFMKASSMQMSPGLNLAMAAGMTYGMRVVALEKSRAVVMKRAAQAG